MPNTASAHGDQSPARYFERWKNIPACSGFISASSPDGGAEAVADYLLARLEVGVRAHKLKRTMQLVRQCQAWMGGRPGTKTSMVDLVKCCIDATAQRTGEG